MTAVQEIKIFYLNWCTDSVLRPEIPLNALTDSNFNGCSRSIELGKKSKAVKILSFLFFSGCNYFISVTSLLSSCSFLILDYFWVSLLFIFSFFFFFNVSPKSFLFLNLRDISTASIALISWLSSNWIKISILLSFHNSYFQDATSSIWFSPSRHIEFCLVQYIAGN